MLLCPHELTLYIGQGNIEMAHGHLGRLMTEKFHNNGQAGTGSEHLSGKRMPKLMRHNTGLDADVSGDLVQYDS